MRIFRCFPLWLTKLLIRLLLFLIRRTVALEVWIESCREGVNNEKTGAIVVTMVNGRVKEFHVVKNPCAVCEMIHMQKCADCPVKPSPSV